MSFVKTYIRVKVDIGQFSKSHSSPNIVFSGIVSGQQLRNAISARSNFGLGFALTHIVIKSDESHRRKYIFDLTIADLTSLPHISIATLSINSCPLSW